jgi:hypothetical protein
LVGLASAVQVNKETVERILETRRTIVRHNNYIIAAYADGFVCYGTYEPRTASCHRAVPKPTYKEIQ